MSVNRRPRMIGIACLLAAVTAGSGALAGPTLAAPRIKYGAGAWLSIAADALRISGLTGALRGLVGPTSVNYGTDGRLSVMVIGSDYRPGHGGERMDAVMVMTINPATHQIAAVSIPRDTGVLPLPNNDPWKGKVNSLYSHYRSDTCDRVCAFDKMRLALGHVLQVEVDYTVFARFTGFDYLVDQLGTVPVDFPLEIRDSRFWDDKDSTTPIGAIFRTGTDVPLGGDLATRCYGGPKGASWSSVPSCFRALVYMRSRHGTVPRTTTTTSATSASRPSCSPRSIGRSTCWAVTRTRIRTRSPCSPTCVTPRSGGWATRR
jgi:hypothetical protein